MIDIWIALRWAWSVMPFRLLLAVVALLLLSVNYAAAEDDRAEIRRQLISSCKFWETCGQYFRHRRFLPDSVKTEPRRYEIERRYEPRVYGYQRQEEYGRQCQEFVVAVGEERYGRDRAKESAEQSYMEIVRNKHGVKWMDLRNSVGGTWECGRSSTGNRASEKAQEVIGKFLEQCELKARPCRAELERVEK